MTRTRLTADWLDAAPTRAVMAALGAQAWFVGGCVRNTLMGRAVSDIDLATPLRPGTVIERIEAAGLRAVPTGIEHGTVTAVACGRPFEITTFRADLATDGRHATVRFGTDMAEDAARRDFTMNALYADAEGRVADPMGGLPDLRAGRVRFIGDPVARIREDHLRLLRFFRFTAWYGRQIDADGLAACAALKAGIAGLARERVGAELARLLAAPDPGATVAAMTRASVLAACLPGAELAARAAALPALVAREAAAGAAPDWRRRLALLAPEVPGEALRLSRADARAVQEIDRLARGDAGAALLAEAAGAGTARSALLVRAARAGADLPAPEALEADLARGSAAVCPLSAEDLMAAGWRPGPALGRALTAARAAWRASDLTLDRAALLDRLGPPPG